jgi:ubiquinone/menaquinone biosynthesis C-methylase UbiE
MDHADHVGLIRDGIPDESRRWLELGAGTGAFTLALLDVLGDAADVVALDRDASALRRLRDDASRRLPRSRLTSVVGDFTDPADVPPGPFDGVLMANSLHFVDDKESVLRNVLAVVPPGGRFLLVEYGSDDGNPWVPWPVSYRTWAALAERVGLRGTRKIGEVPSRFLGSIYAAVSTVSRPIT